jgi:hypothetical protein
VKTGTQMAIDHASNSIFVEISLSCALAAR